MALNWCISKLSERFGHLISSWLKTPIIEINLQLWIHRRNRNRNREQRGETHEFILKDAFFLSLTSRWVGWVMTEHWSSRDLFKLKIFQSPWWWLFVVCDSLPCASSQKHLTGLLGGKSLRNYRGMCLCLPARLQLSTVKAGRGSVSLQNACMCVAWAQTKKKENWTAFTAPLQIHCVTQIWQRLTFSISSPRQ